MNLSNNKSVLILDNVRSVYNVGAIFRTADAAGIAKIFLCGTTPGPLDRFGRARKDLAKAALGAEKTVSWERAPTTETCVKTLKKEDYFLIALEQNRKAVDYKTIHPRFPLALVLGNEVDGISQTILNFCDVVAEIPLQGKKESLNVSVAAGIALFRILSI